MEPTTWIEWLGARERALLMIPLSAVAIYAAVIALTRAMGLRTFSKMSAFDFAITVAIGSIVASVAIAPDPPLLEGLIGLAALYAAQWTIAALRTRYDWARVTDNEPLLLMRGETILHANLVKANVTKRDLLAKLREANVLRFEQVGAVVLESTGDVSVLHSEHADAAIDPELLDGVRLA